MSAPSPLHTLQQLTEKKLADLAQDQPDLASSVRSKLPTATWHDTASPTTNPSPKLKKSDQQLFDKLSLEEQSSAFTTMQSWLTMPFQSPDQTMRLYIEQQLSSLTGLNVSSSVDQFELPVLQSVMGAMPHIKTALPDTLPQHINYLAAGLSRDRSFFGWIKTDPDDTTASEKEKYGVYLPLHLLPTWQTQRDAVIAKYKQARLLVCNPFTKKLVLASCIGWWPPSASRPTSGGTPELIMAAQVWQMSSLGRVLLFLVASDQTTQDTPLGPVELSAQQY